MNCKPGDLALVVRCKLSPENVGKIVRCERLEDPMFIGEAAGSIWRVDREITWHLALGSGRSKVKRPFAPDYCLMPIRPPASDESDTADQDLPAECGA